MSVINPTTNWSAGILLAKDEFWFCEMGAVRVTHEAVPVTFDGQPLVAGTGLDFKAGQTIRHKLNDINATPSRIIRTEVS